MTTTRPLKATYQRSPCIHMVSIHFGLKSIGIAKQTLEADNENYIK